MTVQDLTANCAERTGDDVHLLWTRCPTCTAKTLMNQTLGTVENLHLQYIISDDQLAGYRFVWATSACRYGNYARWTEFDKLHPDAQVYARACQAELARRTKAFSLKVLENTDGR